MDIFKTENRPYACWLIYTLKPEEKLIQYQQNCLLKNHPAAVLPVSSRLSEKHTELSELVIDISGLTSLSQIDDSTTLTPKDGLTRLCQISKTVQTAEDHLLPMSQMILHPDYLFFDDDRQEIKVIVLPLVFAQAEAGFAVEDLVHGMAQAYHWQDEPVGAILQALHAGFTPRFDLFLDTLLCDPQQIKYEKQADSESHERNHTIQTSPSQPNNHTNRTAKHKPDQTGQLSSVQPGHDKKHPFAKFLLFLAHVLVIATAVTSQYWLPVRFSVNRQTRLIILVLFLIPCLILVWTDLRFARRFHASKANGKPEKQKDPFPQADPTESRTLKKHRPLHQMVRDMSDAFNLNGADHIQDNEQNQTVLLNSEDDHFRMAMLSEGLPGTTEENEGLRAFILIDEFIIGRDGKKVDLALEQQTIGRQHARIVRREGTFFISDLGSKNGTSLDGRRLNKFQEYLLPDRCRIQFAEVSMYFQVD